MGFKVGHNLERLSEFLPANVKTRLVGMLSKEFKNRRALIKEIGTTEKTLKKITEENEFTTKPSAAILAMALQRFPETKELLGSELLSELTCLYKELGIIEDKQEKKLNKFMEALDYPSRAIMLFLYRNKYAKINELSNLINSASDSVTLSKINYNVNGAARKILGHPAMAFNESKIDFTTGKSVFFSWWLSEEMAKRNVFEKNNEMLEVLDGKDSLKIILELKNADEKTIKVDANNDVVKVSAQTIEGKYFRRIPVFYQIKKAVVQNYKNGVLEIELKKLEGQKLYAREKK